MNQNKDLELTFHVSKQKIRNQKCFVVGDKKYLIDFDLLIKNSNYFYKNRQQFQYVENIELLGDIEEKENFPEESIEAFISSCQNEQCQIKSNSIFALQYLAYKYEYPEIIDITRQFIRICF